MSIGWVRGRSRLRLTLPCQVNDVACCDPIVFNVFFCSVVHPLGGEERPASILGNYPPKGLIVGCLRPRWVAQNWNHGFNGPGTNWSPGMPWARRFQHQQQQQRRRVPQRGGDAKEPVHAQPIRPRVRGKFGGSGPEKMCGVILLPFYF